MPTPKQTTAKTNKVLKPQLSKSQALKPLLDDLSKQANQYKKKVLDYVQHWEKFKNIVDNNYALGRDHLGRGNFQDAIFRLKFVLWLEPNYKESWYYLGCAYLADGKERLAKDALAKALKQNPTSDGVRYMHALAMGKATSKAELPKSIPKDLLERQFDSLAANYSNDQLGTFKYEGHTQLANAIRSSLVQGRIDHIILDLGVGTGLCGPLLRDTAVHITGVDLSANMLSEAVKVVDERGKKIYDALIRREAIEFITDGPDNSYDIIMAAGLVSYLGDLLSFFEQSARLLKKGGILAFTADSFAETGFQFDPVSGRFVHSQYYLADLATRFNLTEVKTREANIYPESAGLLCVYRK